MLATVKRQERNQIESDDVDLVNDFNTGERIDTTNTTSENCFTELNL